MRRLFILGKIALYTVFSMSLIVLFSIIFVLQQFSLLPSSFLPAQVTAPKTLTTDTWGIFDPETGRIYTGNNTEEVLPIASITKLFVAHAVMKSKMKDEPFTIVWKDIVTEGRSGKLTYGDIETPYSLLFPLLLESSNDASVAIVRSLGDGFPNTQSDLVSTLSLLQTQITDPSGLSANNVSTIADLSRFYAYLKGTHPHILDITQLHTYISTHTGYTNINPARSLSNFTGGKHGFIPEARRTFIGTFMLPESGEEIGIIVLKSDNLLEDINALLAYSERL